MKSLSLEKRPLWTFLLPECSPWPHRCHPGLMVLTSVHLLVWSLKDSLAGSSKQVPNCGLVLLAPTFSSVSDATQPPREKVPQLSWWEQHCCPAGAGKHGSYLPLVYGRPCFLSAIFQGVTGNKIQGADEVMISMTNPNPEALFHWWTATCLVSLFSWVRAPGTMSFLSRKGSLGSPLTPVHAETLRCLLVLLWRFLTFLVSPHPGD